MNRETAYCITHALKYDQVYIGALQIPSQCAVSTDPRVDSRAALSSQSAYLSSYSIKRRSPELQSCDSEQWRKDEKDKKGEKARKTRKPTSRKSRLIPFPTGNNRSTKSPNQGIPLTAQLIPTLQMRAAVNKGTKLASIVHEHCTIHATVIPPSIPRQPNEQGAIGKFQPETAQLQEIRK